MRCKWECVEVYANRFHELHGCVGFVSRIGCDGQGEFRMARRTAVARLEATYDSRRRWPAVLTATHNDWLIVY